MVQKHCRLTNRLHTVSRQCGRMSRPAAAWRPLTDKVSNDKHRRSAAALGKLSPRASAVLSTMKSNQWLSHSEWKLPSASLFRGINNSYCFTNALCGHSWVFFGGGQHLELHVRIWISLNGLVLVCPGPTQQINREIWLLSLNFPQLFWPCITVNYNVCAGVLYL